MKGLYCKALSKAVNPFSSTKLDVYQDPKIFRINQVEPHVPLRVFDTKEECLKYALDKKYSSRWSVKLADSENPTKCAFQLYSSPKELPDCFENIPFELEIPVPMNWQMIDTLDTVLPIYTNVSYPWKRSGFGPCKLLSYYIPYEQNFTGIYKFPICLNSQWIAEVKEKRRSIFLILHGVSSAVKVYIDEEFVGYGQDSMTEKEFDITKFLKFDSDESSILYLIVYQWSDGSYLEDQDQWWMSGIFRDVELQCRPVEGIKDYFLRAERQSDGTGNVDINILIDTNKPKVVVGRIFDPESLVVLETVQLRAKPGDTSCKMNMRFTNARIWNTTDPYLYHLMIEITSQNEVTLQAEMCSFGFRKVEIASGQLRLNGETMLICGVNRHEHDPKTAKVVKEKLMIKDIMILKQHNFNAVRCSHYPNCHRWYDLCDEYGIYIIDEANMETHGFALGGAISLLQCDAAWRDQIFWRTKAMFHRTKNHTCIIGWSLGNESGSGPNLRTAADWIRKQDDTRIVQYEGGIRSGDSPLILGDGHDPYLSDIVCPMYHTPVDISTSIKSDKRPLILCEYSHAMGNSNGGLHLYFDLFKSKKHPQLQGGFIWDYVDQGLSIPRFLEGNWGYGGDYGKKSGTSDSTFCINGLVWPDRTCHPAMIEAKYLQQALEIHLKQKSTNEVELMLVKCGQDCPPFADLEVQFYVQNIDKPLRETPDMSDSLDCSNNVFNKEYRFENLVETKGIWIRACIVLKTDKKYARKGHVVAFEGIQISPQKVDICSSLKLTAGEAASFEAKTSKDYLLVKTHTYSGEFNLQLGELEKLQLSNGLDVLKTPVAHNFYRACTDNDLGGVNIPFPINRYRSFASQWRKMGLNYIEQVVLKCTILNKTESEASVEVIAQQVALKSFLKWVLFTTKTRYTFSSSGIKIQVKVEAMKRTLTAKSLPRIGLSFMVTKTLSKVRWQGRGPHECYPDRKRSAFVGVYESDASEMHVPYIHPSENGGRADVEWIALTDPSTGEGLIIAYRSKDDEAPDEILEGFDDQPFAKISARPAGMKGAQVSISKYSVQELDQAKHDFELHPSEGWHVQVDTAHMGLGGDNSWLPATHEQYLFHGGPWNYEIDLQPCKL